MIIETSRLILRQWKTSDRKIFHELNSDPENMQFFPSTYTGEQSDEFINETMAFISKNGFGRFATELKATNQFIGFIGLTNPTYKTHFTPCTEIAWRLHKNFWGNGYATEGANAVIDFAFDTLKMPEIVSFTSPLNLPSIKVMQRIGMQQDLNGSFDHPNVATGHKLKKHVLYRKFNHNRYSN